jgi:type II secretory pathway component GspD/PulD (secretin)
MAKRIMALVLLVALSILCEKGHTQDACAPGESPAYYAVKSGRRSYTLVPASEPTNKRTIYVVKHGDAKELAGILGKHFKGVAEIQVLPDSPSNCLLISADSKVFTEVVQLLEKLDRRPQVVSVELLIAEVPASKAKDGKLAPGKLDEKEFSGPAKEVVEKLEARRGDGSIASLKRIQLTAVENQIASVTLGETKPIVSAVTVTGTGRVAKSIMYRNTGTKAQITVRVAPENAVVLELDINDTRLHIPEGGIELGKDAGGESIRAVEIASAILKSKLTVRSEHALVAQGVKTESKSSQAQTLIVVTARILDAGTKAAK